MTIASRPAAAARAALVVAALLAAGAATDTRAGPPDRKLTLAASANLRLALEEVAGAFERRNPGVKVEVTYGATGALYAQVRNGAPFDLLLGADRDVAVRLQDAGLSAGPAFHYATGRLVLWIAGQVRVSPGTKGLRSLTEAGVKKVAIANPAVAPYGVAAEKALRSAGLLEVVQPKLVMGESILQVIQFAQTGNVQAAFVPWSMAIVPPLASLGRHAVVPAGSYPPIEQWGVVLRAAREPELAAAFESFLRGTIGRTVLDRHGYLLPPG